MIEKNPEQQVSIIERYPILVFALIGISTVILISILARSKSPVSMPEVDTSFEVPSGQDLDAAAIAEMLAH